MLEIYVDADACPVKEEAVKVADRHRLPVHFVSNQPVRLPIGLDVRRVVVPDSFDAADDWIAARAGKGDIVATADIPLAERCLKSGAAVIGFNGRPFTADGIGMASAMRLLQRDLREIERAEGARSRGGAAFSKRDRSAFLEALENAVQRAKRAG
jgi:hypothetical protein